MAKMVYRQMPARWELTQQASPAPPPPPAKAGMQKPQGGAIFWCKPLGVRARGGGGWLWMKLIHAWSNWQNNKSMPKLSVCDQSFITCSNQADRSSVMGLDKCLPGSEAEKPRKKWDSCPFSFKFGNFDRVPETLWPGLVRHWS